MQIANPIYDAVFKYLMEDSKSAEILISTIIGKEILSLEPSPQEKVHRLEKSGERVPLTVYRLDFAAKIKTPAGYQTILIEIQKAKYAADILRFRRYLGSQYKDKKNTYKVKYGFQGESRERRKAIPILTIYFLGYKLDHTDAPVIKVARNYYDNSTGEALNIKEEFIESLTHDSFVIQVPCLRKETKNETEKLLSVFNQEFSNQDEHILIINENDYPEKYHPVIRRLQRAAAQEEIRDIMDIEDDYLEELYDLERAVERAVAKKDKALKENKKALEEKDRTIQENQKALQEKDKTLQEKDKTLQEKDKTLQEKDKLIEQLLKEQMNYD